MCFSLAIRALVPAVPRESQHPVHAPFTPVAVCPVTRHPTDLSQKRLTPLVLTTSESFRRVIDGFAFARLPDAHLLGVMPRTFVPTLTTTASMGRFLSRPAPRGLSAYFSPFPRPDPHGLRSRRAQMPSRMARQRHRRLVLDGFEHDGTLERVGMTTSEGSCGLVHEGSCHILVCGGPKTQTMMQ